MVLLPSQRHSPEMTLVNSESHSLIVGLAVLWCLTVLFRWKLGRDEYATSCCIASGLHVVLVNHNQCDAV